MTGSSRRSDDGAAQIQSEQDLRASYGDATEDIRDKALRSLDCHARRFIELSPFMCIGSSRPGDLADVSPRGGEPGFVHVLDDTHIAFPDRPGNNRLDTLTNIMHSPAVGLLFFVPGVNEMLRVNGRASVTCRADLMQRFVYNGKPPRSVIVVETVEVYLHCAKALKRAELWNPAKQIVRSNLPTYGQMIKDQYRLPVTAAVIDTRLKEDASENLY